MKNITDYIQQWANTYKDDMQNNIMPFWIKYEWWYIYLCRSRRCING